MDHAPARVLRDYLVGTGVVADAAAFHSVEPDAPDSCVTVYDREGQQDGRTAPDNVSNVHPGVQVRVRSVDFTGGWATAVAVRSRMEQAVNASVTVEGKSYVIYAVTKIGPVLPIGLDNPRTKRRLYTINAYMALQEL